MRHPRDISGMELAKAMEKIGYRITRQTGSHIRLTVDFPTQQHITIPAHDPLKLGTLAAILADVGTHLQLEREELLRRIF